jgi:peptide chain release factor 1
MTDQPLPDYLQRQINELDKRLEQAKQLINDPSLSDLAQEEITQLEKQKNDLLASINHPETNKVTNYQPVFNDALLEIRGAAGGEEAKIWAADLLRMYTRYANLKNYKVEQLDDLVLRLRGKRAYEQLKYESGVHRVQRIPETEKSGRVHTSTASVAILPIIQAQQIEVKEEELAWHFTRAGGHGGQNVNKVNTAVELTHIPTGIVVRCRQERFQQQNREIALEMLRSMLWERQEEKRLSSIETQRRSAVGRGMRAEKIRTYNYPQDRVTDHRIKESFRLQDVMEGDLDKIIQSLKTAF